MVVFGSNFSMTKGSAAGDRVMVVVMVVAGPWVESWEPRLL